jgi:hypothetical protein
MQLRSHDLVTPSREFDGFLLGLTDATAKVFYAVVREVGREPMELGELPRAEPTRGEAQELVSMLGMRRAKALGAPEDRVLDPEHFGVPIGGRGLRDSIEHRAEDLRAVGSRGRFEALGQHRIGHTLRQSGEGIVRRDRLAVPGKWRERGRVMAMGERKAGGEGEAENEHAALCHETAVRTNRFRPRVRLNEKNMFGTEWLA